LRHVVVAAVAAGVAAAGCGNSVGSGSERQAVSAAPTLPATSAPRARVGGTVLHGRHLREYRRVIVALYRVPGAVALNRRYKNPLDQLRHRLETTYGPALKPIAPWPQRRDRA
jgi:hypothetical protein